MLALSVCPYGAASSPKGRAKGCHRSCPPNYNLSACRADLTRVNALLKAVKSTDPWRDRCFCVFERFYSSTSILAMTAAQRGHRPSALAFSECIQQRGHLAPLASLTPTVRLGKFTPAAVSAPSSGADQVQLETMKISARFTPSQAAYSASSVV